jgi:hypothetical protein
MRVIMIHIHEHSVVIEGEVNVLCEPGISG